MTVKLAKAQLADLPELMHQLKIIFTHLLDKYHNNDINPVNLSQEHVVR